MFSSSMLIRRGASAVILASALGLGAGAARADDASGWYVGALGGLNFTETSSSILPSVSTSAVSLSHKTGWGLGALAGYDFGPFRLQGDVVYRRNKFDQISQGSSEADLDGRVTSIAPMLSALYDIPTGTSFTPYIGAGVGAARTTVKGNGEKESAWAMAYQGIAGVSFDLNPDVVLGAEYRYFSAKEKDYGETLRDYEYDNHSILFGITYRFGAAPAAPVSVAAVAPPPPPPPPPAPELARSYIVFFDWNSSAITSEAATIISEAAGAAKKLAVTRIDLTGHADRSGTPAYNQQLSDKRGVAVKNALVQLGIAETDISVVGKGETTPLVPTADGVREPQNRRVEIVLP